MIKGCYRKQEHSGLKLNSCNSNRFINSVCLCEGSTFIFFKGGEEMSRSRRNLAANGMSS